MKGWYIVQVYTGFEDIVKKDLSKRIEEESLQDLFGEIVVPAAKQPGLVEGAIEENENIFPGYLFVQMDMTGESFQLVSSVPRVSSFLGGKSPVQVTEKEIEKVFSQLEGKVELAKGPSPFSVGSEVHIVSGPFSGFVCIVERADEEREKLTVMISIFGRLTPVELGFDQVKR
jgi:transcription termination/antitermination protein NusG